MSGFTIDFDKPWYLLLLLLLPLLWVFSYHSLSGLGRFRRLLALALRTLLLVLIILALAEVQLKRTSDKVTVIYLLDQSASIPSAKRQLMMDYVIRDVAKHRNSDRQDEAGVIVFGRDAIVEIPPFADDIPNVGRIESYLDLRPDATNLAAALKLAQASFPEGAAKRIVAVTDGNENLGNARMILPALRDNGIGVDVVPVQLERRGEVVVEKMTLPTDVRKGQPVESRVVVTNEASEPVTGKLTITRFVGSTEQLLSELPVTLAPGKNVYTVNHQLDESGFFNYRAVFAPEDPQNDLMPQNNTATAFTYVRGKGRVLLVEDWEHPGDYDYLVNRLRANEIDIEVRGSDEPFRDLADLQNFDAVVLANVPRTSGEDSNSVTNFSDEMIATLVRNTEQMGAGLIMLGGPNSFGAGGWANTELEKAMPVDFKIKNAKVQAVGALVLMMHASEMAQGNYWQKVVGMEAIKALGPMDYCGLVHWNNTAARDDWLWGAPQGLVQVGGRRQTMVARLNRMTPGDMPQFDPAMRLALNAFRRVNAATKHMIIISDGDPAQPSPLTVAAYQRAKIQISTVAIGTHGPPGSTPLQNLAVATGGKYYVVTNPKALPRIYQREARRVSRPLIYEPDGGVVPQVVYDHEMHNQLAVNESLPPLRGFMLTSVKDNPLVEVSILSPKPVGQKNSTILATWTYGLGRTVAFTTDAGNRWAGAWQQWPQYDKFFTQMVRWAMRPVDDGKFVVATDYKDGRVRVVVTAVDEASAPPTMTGTIIGPDMQAVDLKVEQVAPGRFIGEFEALQPGNFFVTVNPGSEEMEVNGQTVRRPRAQLRTGISVPYSAEYRDRETNLALLRTLAETRPSKGEPGEVIEGDMTRADMNRLLEVDTFRQTLGKAVSIQDVWHLVLLWSACLFFADVFVRRVAFDFSWLTTAYAAVRDRFVRKEEGQEVAERLERLRSQKEAIAGQIDERRAAARFEPQPDEAAAAGDLDRVLSEQGGATPRPAAPPPPSTGLAAGDAEQESYTSRLLKAKKEAWKDNPQ